MDLADAGREGVRVKSTDKPVHVRSKRTGTT